MASPLITELSRPPLPVVIVIEAPRPHLRSPVSNVGELVTLGRELAGDRDSRLARTCPNSSALIIGGTPMSRLWETGGMFDVDVRESVTDSILALVSRDPRVTAGAVVGSLALTAGDRFSDIDPSFAIRDGIDLWKVLDDWTTVFASENEIDVLFDLVSGPSIYRVYLFPGALQVDLSVTPASSFGQRGDTFRLLFGGASTSSDPVPRPDTDMAGYAVHHVLHARMSIERGHLVQAAYWINELRNEALYLAMSRAGVEPSQARGAHLLPSGLSAQIERSFPTSLGQPELRRALAESMALLRLTTHGSGLLTERVLAQLHELGSVTSI